MRRATDRYGVSWQIVPSAMMKFLGGADRAGAQRAMQAMMKMVKLDIAALQKAYDGGYRRVPEAPERAR